MPLRFPIRTSGIYSGSSQKISPGSSHTNFPGSSYENSFGNFSGISFGSSTANFNWKFLPFFLGFFNWTGFFPEVFGEIVLKFPLRILEEIPMRFLLILFSGIVPIHSKIWRSSDEEESFKGNFHRSSQRNPQRNHWKISWRNFWSNFRRNTGNDFIWN